MTEDEFRDRQTRALETIAAGVALLVEYAHADHSAHYARDLPDDFDLRRLVTEGAQSIALRLGDAAATNKAEEKTCANCGHSSREHRGFGPRARVLGRDACAHDYGDARVCECPGFQGQRLCGQSLAAVGIETPCPLPAGHDGACRLP